MAYFPNGISGEVFDEQCERCKYGERPCPIAGIQQNYNYDVVDNKVATAILDDLVKNNGTCAMFRMFESDFKN